MVELSKSAVVNQRVSTNFQRPQDYIKKKKKKISYGNFFPPILTPSSSQKKKKRSWVPTI